MREALTGLAARIDRLSLRALTVAVALAQVVALLPMAIARDIDGDEGYYTLAASLVGHGKLPYEDFFYPQMPLVPLTYGPWTRLFGETWVVARSLSVVCAAVLGVLLFRHAAAKYRSASVGVLAAALYLSSMLVLLWMTVVKTYALSTVLLVGAFVLADRTDLPQTRRRWLAAGALLGLSVDARLIAAAVVPVLLVYAYRAGRRDGRGRELVGAHLAGLVLGLLPALWFLAADPRRFWFHNLGYHSVRSPGGLFGAMSDKLSTLGELVSSHPQFALLTVLAVLTLGGLRLLRRPLPPALPVAFMLALAAIAPNPPFVQDYAPIVPFLVLGILDLVTSLDAVAAAIRRPRLAAALRIGVPASLIAYLIIPLVAVPLATRDGYLGGGDIFADELRPSTVRAVTRALDAQTRPGEEVLAFWPGYLFGSHADPVPGFENDFGPQGVLNAGYTDAKASRYLLASPHRLDEIIRQRRVRHIVIGALGDWTKRHDSLPLILRSGYRPVETVGVTRILVRGAPGPIPTIEDCLRRGGFRPALAPRVRDAAPIGITLASGREGRLFVYPTPRRAQAALGEVASFLRLPSRAVTRAGAVAVAYTGTPSPAEAARVAACARRGLTASRVAARG